MANPRCPICGEELRKRPVRRRGATFVCLTAMAEQYKDARGHIKRKPGALHPYVRVWHLDELEQGADDA